MSNKLAKTDSVSIIVATYGDAAHWNEVAKPAVASAEAQTIECEVIRMHRGSLADARNEAAFQANSEWLVFLDADDTLEPDYVEQMLNVAGDIRRPITRGIHANGVVEEPRMIPRSDILTSNYIIIGAMVRKEMFEKVGGFDDTLDCLEDWDLWLRCIVNEKAKVTDVPLAVYNVTVNTTGRNFTQNRDKTYNTIKRRYR